MDLNVKIRAITAVGERLAAAIKANAFGTGFAAAAILGFAWIVRDYREWKAFGTGGTPPNVFGYSRMTLFRILYTYYIPRQTNPETLSMEGPSYLDTSSLPTRVGGRPRIMSRILPQRQIPEPIDASTRAQLMSLMQRLANQHPDILEIKPSQTEGRTTDGLYARTDTGNEKNINPLAVSDRLIDYEIAHAHPAENSLHVWLSDPDARKVIAANWGQRFCLPFVQSGWVMVYAPRDGEELKLVEGIVRAGVR